MDRSYLVVAAQRLEKAVTLLRARDLRLRPPPTPNLEWTKFYLGILCETIGRLATDSELLKFQIEQRYESHGDAINLGAFLHRFFALEYDLLIQHGVNATVARYILNDYQLVNTFSNRLKADGPNIYFLDGDLADIEPRIQDFAKGICSEYDRIKALTDRTHVIDKVSGGLMVIVGALTKIANTIGDVASFGAVSKLSDPFGGFIIDRGIRKWKDSEDD